MNKVIIFIAFFVTPLFVSGRDFCLVDEDVVIKGGKTYEAYYAFAEGDEVSFSMTCRRKKIFECNIYQLPTTLLFRRNHKDSIKSNIVINGTGILRFEIRNKSLLRKNVRVKIVRKCKEVLYMDFTSAVDKEKVKKNLYYIGSKDVVVGNDTTIENITDRKQTVHSKTSIKHKNRTILEIDIPSNTVSWAYWIGVGEEASKAYATSLKRFLQSSSVIALKIPDYGPIAAVALNGVALMINTTTGDNVKYSLFRGSSNRSRFMNKKVITTIKKGDVVYDYSQVKNGDCGIYYLGLLNDNFRTGIDVTIKVVAIVVNKRYVQIERIAYK